MPTPAFHYQDPFPLSKDQTRYRLLGKEGVSVTTFEGKEILRIDPSALERVAHESMRELSFFLRPEHNEQVAKILSDPDASQNDRGVAVAFLRNAEIAAQGELPICQDTGTAIVMGKKGQQVWTGVKDEESISRGVYRTYTEENLRYSQTAPLNMYDEVNTGTNLPAQIDLYATEGAEYKFLFVAKGGGSANKTMLLQETKALLTPEKLEKFLVEKMKYLGTAACPPYHIAVGRRRHLCRADPQGREARLHQVLDGLPTEGNAQGQAFRDVELEKRLLEAASKLGIGAQFGGKYFAHDIRVVRLPRHGASCPVGMGVSCSADRNVKAKINRDGIWLEELDREPRPAHPGGVPRQARTRGEDRPQPAHEGDRGRAVEAPGLDAAAPQRDAGGRPRHRPRQVQGAHRRREGRARVLEEPPGLLRRARPRRRRASHPARSGRPPPAAWTPTWTCSSPTARRSS